MKTATGVAPNELDLQREPDGIEELRQVARVLVGRIGLREAISVLRNAMLEEALARTNGSRHAAARLLSVNRRAIQRHATDLGL